VTAINTTTKRLYLMTEEVEEGEEVEEEEE
jgi:hypothetical protein